MPDDKRVVNLVAKGAPDAIAQAVGEMRERLPAMIEHQRIIVKLQRETYDAAIKEGFTPNQALELCKGIR